MSIFSIDTSTGGTYSQQPGGLGSWSGAMFGEPGNTAGQKPNVAPNLGNLFSVPQIQATPGMTNGVYNTPQDAQNALMAKQQALFPNAQDYSKVNSQSMFGSSSWNAQPYQPTATDSWLAGLQGQLGYLQDWANAPKPVNWTPAWESMKTSQERGIQKGAADLGEYFNTMGGRFSTAYGNAMGDYYGQTAKDQNAMLGMLESQSLESAFNRQYGAAGQLGQLAFQGPALQSQLGNQRYMQQNSQEYGLENLLRNQQYGAAMYNAQAADSAASSLYQGSIYGANALNQGSTLGAQNLYGTSNAAANSLYNAQNSALPLALQSFFQNSGLNTAMAQNLGGLSQSNQALGLNMGNQQFNTLDQQISRAYQEWIRTQPQNNPLISLMQQGAFGQANMYYPQYQPGNLGSLMGGVGSLLPIILQMMQGGGGGGNTGGLNSPWVWNN